MYNDLGEVLNTKLQRLINKGIRFIFNLRYDEHITPYREQLGWLTVKNRRLYFLGIEMFKIERGISPSYLVDFFVRHDGSLLRSRRIAGPQTFHIPLHRTATYQNSFHLAGIYLWNFLPDTVTSAPSLAVFKARLNAHLALGHP